MMTITAEQVKELRERTGAGMMDCKKALAEADGDLEKADRGPAQEAALAKAREARRPRAPTRAWSRPTSTPAARSAC